MMDETKYMKPTESELSQDKEKAVLAGLSAVTGAAAVGAAVYSHEASEENVAGTSEENQPDSVQPTAVSQQAVAEPVQVSAEVVEVTVEQDGNDAVTAVAETVSPAEILLGEEHEVAGGEDAGIVDANGNPLTYGEDILASDEQLVQDLQSSGQWDDMPDMPQSGETEIPEENTGLCEDNLYWV